MRQIKSHPPFLGSDYEFGVYPFSVGQATYDLLRNRSLASKQNLALKKKGDEVAEIIRRASRKPEAN